MPEVVGVDPAKQKQKSKAIDELRICIAHRWGQLGYLRSSMTLNLSDYKQLVEDLISSVGWLCEVHGQDLPFAPDLSCMTEKFRSNHFGHPNQEDQKDCDLSVVASTTGSEASSSSRVVLPHEFRWLQMPDGVWTVLQATYFQKTSKDH